MRSRLAAIAFLLAVTSVGGAFALDEVPYGVAREPWEEGLGNHRAVVRVEQKAEAVRVNIPWRRRDRDPERKQIIVMDAATGQRVTNVARLHLDRFEGALAFQPQTVPGDYFVYYLPFKPQPGWGNYNYDYLPPQETASPDWRAHLPQDLEALPRASVVLLEARTEFDSFYPMEVVATPEETQGLLDRSAAFMLQHPGGLNDLQPEGRAPTTPPYLVFPEDRRFPIRMMDELPLRWAKSGPAKVFSGEAQRNEFYVFQIGVWAARTNLTGLNVEFEGEIAKWLNCFNTGGTNWDGKPFHKTLNVPQGKVQALWLGVDVPRDANPGEHSATVTVRPTNAPAVSIEFKLKVLPGVLEDRGDSEPLRLARLRWLDSAIGFEDGVLKPYTPVEGHAASQERWRFTRAALGQGGKPVQKSEMDWPAFRVKICSESGEELLQAPISFRYQRAEPLCDGLRSGSNTPPVTTTVGSKTASVVLDSDLLVEEERVTVESDGHSLHTMTMRAKSPMKASVQVEIPFDPETATYFMGLGLPACRTPTNYTWRWTGPYNSFWIGNARAGLHLKLLGSTYEGPMQNLYHPKPPPNWFNTGKGGITITNNPYHIWIEIFTGPFELKAGEDRAFDFSLLVTPVKPLDTATHFRERYWHSTAPAPPDVNVINVHHATLPNPFINYPFLAVDTLRAFCRTNQAAGRKVKIYYTVRELTSHLPELWALRSLGDEVLAGGSGGGFPWLREHLATGYTTAWYNIAEGGVADAAILTSGASRWYNFYVEGLNWLVRNVPIDGLYLDDVAYDRTILKRMRKVLDRARPGCLIDLHSNTLFSKGPANQYTEFFPYVNRLWFGEGFKYDDMTPEQWLVECSGIPFGLMGDMLEGGGNRWRGMVFGMTARAPWASPDPHHVWQVWDEFSIGDARMIGWWETNCPVRTGRDDVLATAYVKPGKTLLALASWAPDKTSVRLQLDWPALGLEAGKARLIAPEVKEFQPASEWRVDEPISVEPKRGWLIYVDQ